MYVCDVFSRSTFYLRNKLPAGESYFSPRSCWLDSKSIDFDVIIEFRRIVSSGYKIVVSSINKLRYLMKTAIFYWLVVSS